MKKAWNFTVTMWRPVLVWLALALLLFVLFVFRLGSLTGHASHLEVQTYQASSSLSAIWDHPENAPYKLVIYTLQSVSGQLGLLRLVSASIGIATVFFFFLVARRLLEPLVAIGTTTLFATSTIFLQTSRSLTADSMLLGMVFLLWLALIFRYYRATQFAWILGGIIIGLLLYTPGLAIFILAALAWQSKRIRESFERLQPLTIALATTLMFAALLPIIITIVINPGEWRAFLGLPQQFDSLVNIGKAIAYVPVSIIGPSPHDPVHWLGRQPMLDVMASVLFIYGIIAVIRRPKLDRFWALLGIFAVGSIWVGLSGHHSNIIILVPFIYLTIGFGIQALLNQWFKTFPRNPLAQWLAIGIMALAVMFSINFQLLRYFVAWAHSPETRAAYSQRIPR